MHSFRPRCKTASMTPAFRHTGDDADLPVRQGHVRFRDEQRSSRIDDHANAPGSDRAFLQKPDGLDATVSLYYYSDMKEETHLVRH